MFPLHAVLMVQTDEYTGGSLGEIRASDQDPHDQLHFKMLPDDSSHPQGAFSIDLESGRLSTTRSLGDGHYSMNVSVSDGKFTTYSPAKIQVNDITDDMIVNGMILVLGGATPEEFILSYRRSFLRSVKNIMNVDSNDVIILSIQPKSLRLKRQETIESFRPVLSRHRESDISVLFCVRKTTTKYFHRKELFNKIASDVSIVESTMGLRVLRLEGNMCHNITCSNGHCEDVIDLENSPVVVTTEAMNFVSMKHRHEGVCFCPTGYAGQLCDKVVNECAHSPCPKFKECVPNDSDRGYSCICPNNLVGNTCSKKISECVGFQNTPECYSPNNPISFSGPAFTQYNLRTSIDDKLEFSTWFRTIQMNGNLMFISGRIDYSVLEVSYLPTFQLLCNPLLDEKKIIIYELKILSFF